ncbi:MAG TPA: GtrA family protein [Acetobacteraceae bacterium]
MIATLAQNPLIRQFLRFGTVGMVGFVFDVATVYALAGPLGLYAAGVVAYVVAASVNWALNRVWTFNTAPREAMGRQWAAFLLVNLVGFVINRGLYMGLIYSSPLCAAYPVLAILAGVLAGMFLNFGLSRRYVFRGRTA